MNKILLFPIAFALNSFSLQLLIVFAGLSGKSVVAADLSLAQASMLAVFFALSGNARNLIIKSDSSPQFHSSLVKFRIVLAPFLSVLAVFLSVLVSKVALALSLVILLRQLAEWFSELQLSASEKAGDTGFAYAFIWATAVPLFLAIAALLFAPPLFIWALGVWALAPAFLCIGFFKKAVSTVFSSVTMDWQRILPNCASTIVVGSGVFFFRLLISGFAGKAAAGEFFTAFALGGIISSVYERSIGPTLNIASSVGGFRARLFRLAWLIPVVGLLVVAAYYSGLTVRLGLARGGYLVPAIGFSLIGGFVMLRAQALKIALLHSKDFNDLFMPDLLSNFLILFSVPVSFLLFGSRAFVWIFLLNALFVYVCYFVVIKTENISAHVKWANVFQWLVGLSVIAPLFFQLGRGIFRSQEQGYDWGGSLSLLPLPLSLFVCFPAILLFQAFKRNRGLPGFIFAIFGLMLCSTVSVASDPQCVKDKILLALQYILPYWGLVLGEYADVLENFGVRLGKIFLVVLTLVIPAQVVVSLSHGSAMIQPNLFFFSVYGNLQYAPLIFLSGFIFAVFSVYGIRRNLILSLIPFMFLYSGMSWSISAVLFLFWGLFLFWFFYMPGWRFFMPVLLGIALFVSYGMYLRNTGITYKFKFLSRTTSITPAMPVVLDAAVATVSPVVSAPQPAATPVLASLYHALPNLKDRAGIWDYYTRAVRDSDLKSFLLGHSNVPDRKLFPSAHNYYLDMMYNWGIFPVILLLSLLAYTVFMVWCNIGAVRSSPYAVGLVFIVFFLVVIDNSLKVGLRQPYSGIYTFFLWGFLISRLKHMKTERLRAGHNL